MKERERTRVSIWEHKGRELESFRERERSS